MTRDLAAFADREFDVVVIGGGIHGACVAWDAALRGLSVALLEQGDFGHATSANSQKIAHGGFRYLQHGDLTRMRRSILERNVLLRIAPHLVRPLPCLLPTYRRQGVQRRSLLRAALAVYDAIAFDRNRGIADAARRIPSGRIVSREECLRLAPGLAAEGVTGGAVWYDGQIMNPDRLTLAFVRGAAAEGACVANYVRVTGLQHVDGRVTGARAVDRLTGRTLEVRGRMVVSASGPWLNRVLGLAHGARPERLVRLSKAINVITRPVTEQTAVGVILPHRPGNVGGHDGCCRRLFIVPWRGRSIIGSLNVRDAGDPDACGVSDAEISRLLEGFNRAYPGAGLRVDEVTFAHMGLLPLAERGPQDDPDNLAMADRIVDHGRRDGLQGLVSVVGVKYTTARDVAQRTVDAILQKLGEVQRPARSADVPLPGGRIPLVETLIRSACRDAADFGEDVATQLTDHYGSDYPAVLRLAAGQPSLAGRVVGSSDTLKAQIVYAVRHEMAQTLSDVVLRRTGLGTAAHPGTEALRVCAELMADELGWDPSRTASEVDAVNAVLSQHHALPSPASSAAGGRPAAAPAFSRVSASVGGPSA